MLYQFDIWVNMKTLSIILILSLLGSSCIPVEQHSTYTLKYDQSTDLYLAGCIRGVAKYQLWLDDENVLKIDQLTTDIRESICVSIFHEMKLKEINHDL